MSTAGGLHKALDLGQEAGCSTIQLFVKNNKSWQAPALTDDQIETFRSRQETTGINPLVCHAGYLINLAAPEEDKLKQSRESMLDEMGRCAALEIDYIVVHPGSHKKTGEDEGMSRVAQSLDWLFERHEAELPRILLETTAGQGSNLGYTFEQLAVMIDRSENSEEIGVCLDTCHVFAAGYELRSEEGYEETIEAFESALGIEKLNVFHFNDSQHELDSRRDRHDHIGNGRIGMSGFRNIVRDERVNSLPIILETPKEDGVAADVENMMILKGLAGGN